MVAGRCQFRGVGVGMDFVFLVDVDGRDAIRLRNKFSATDGTPLSASICDSGTNLATGPSPRFSLPLP